MYKIGLLTTIGIACLVSLGCGDGLSSLRGTVTIDGKPAREGLGLQFQPIGAGSPSYATTDKDGNYVAQFTHRASGIQPGKHRVSLVPGGGGGGEQIPDNIDDAMSRRKVDTAEQANRRAQLPQSYYSEITVITVESGSNTINIALESVQPK